MISQDRLKKILRMPPRQIAGKVWRKARAALTLFHERRRDQQHTTFADSGPHIRIENHHAITVRQETLRRHEAQILMLAARYGTHEFDLLGSEWVQVAHGMSCRGVEGRRYESGPTVDADARGNWLKARINPANLSEAQRIWQLVDPGYQPIDWHLDFKSGHRWSESTYARDIRYGHLAGVDVKAPWELSRMQHLPTLALAFALGPRDEHDRNLREFRNQVLDFIATNPPRYGVNWTCTMDVAIRAANWLFAYDLYRGAGASFDEAFTVEFTRSIYQHGLHIGNHLEWNEHLRGNHYLADVVGLLFVATHLSATPETDTWLAFAVQELLKESATQFHDDGSNFEASTCYHRLSGEMLAHATALILGLPPHRHRALQQIDPRRWHAKPALETSSALSPSGQLPAWYMERLARAGEFAMAATHPDGQSVQIGDNDSGRFLKLLNDPPLDPRPFVAALSGLFHREDFAEFAGAPRLEGDCIASLARGRTLSSTPGRSSAYPRFGLYLLEQGGIRAWVRCGCVGQNGHGGHAHDDQLSFELAVDGTRLIVDPGTYLYTPVPEQRNVFRASAMHNTLTLVDNVQHSFQAGIDSLFCMHDPEATEVLACSETEFLGRRCHPRVDHRRTLRVEAGALHGNDECPLPGRKRVHFHLAPDIRAALFTAGEGVELTAPNGARYELTGGPGMWQVRDSSYSAGYGMTETNQVVMLEFAEPACSWRIARRG